MEWLGANAILLEEYLENKQKLSELKEKLHELSRIRYL